MHFRNNKLKFVSSKDVKKEIAKVNGTYLESMDIYEKIKDKTEEAIEIAQSIEQQVIMDNKELLYVNPHTSIYKILTAINELKMLYKII